REKATENIANRPPEPIAKLNYLPPVPIPLTKTPKSWFSSPNIRVNGSGNVVGNAVRGNDNTVTGTINCPSVGLCAGRDINLAPPPPPPPTIKACVSYSGPSADGIYSTVVSLTTNVQTSQPGFVMLFDKPVDREDVKLGFHPLMMDLGFRDPRVSNKETSIGFKIGSIDMSRSIWNPTDGPIEATITSKSPAKLVKIEG